MKFTEKAKRFFTLSAKHEGFTLVELIVVIAILAILAGVAVPAYSGYINKAKTAGDETLLRAVNEAFAAACSKNGSDIYWISNATVTMEDGAVTGIGSVSSSLSSVNAAEINDAFQLFFAGNEGSKFEVYESLYFDPAKSQFCPGTAAYANAYQYILGSMGTQIGAVNSSAFGTIGATNLLGQVSDVASMATDLIKGNSTLTNVVFSEDYLNTLANKMGMSSEDLTAKLTEMERNDPEGLAQFMANSTVLNVAATMNGMTADQEATAKNNLASLNFANLGTTLNTDPEEGLAQAAMLYGMYTAFNPEGAAGIANSADVSALINLKNDTTTKNAAGQTFAEYMAEINNPNSQAAKDYEGYKSALQIVDGAVTNDSDVANQVMTNGYADAELLAMMQQALASQNN